jgi:O-acetylserine/cysteine efflux transporter
MKVSHLLIALIVMILFGSSYPIGKIGLGMDMSPFQFATIRIFVMMIILLPFLKLTTLTKENFRYVMSYGLLMGVGLYPLMYLALLYTESTSSIILVMQFSIPIGVLLGSVVLKENVSHQRWYLIMLILIGMALICFEPTVFKKPVALIFGFIAAVCYGIASMISRKIANFSAIEVNGWMAVIGLPVILIASLLFDTRGLNELFQFSWQDYLPAIFSGVVISCGAQILMLWLYKHYDVQVVLPLYSLFPVFGVLLTVLMLQEQVSMMIIIGGLIVISGNYLLVKIK